MKKIFSLPKDILILILAMVVLVAVIVVMTLRESAATTANQEKPQDIPVQEQKKEKKPSGLEYIDQRIGFGEAVKSGSKIKVFYTGMMKDGKVFESNVGQEPFLATLGQTPLIRGWNEGLLDMKAGGKRKLFIPYKLAYGEDGKPPRIPPKADLIFEIEVTEVKNR